MANTTIAIKKSATTSAVPSGLQFGELAINYADGKLFYKNVNSSIVEFSPTTSSFGTVNANNTLVVSDSVGDILTLLPGTNITIVGDAVNDTVTFSANLSPAFTIANAAFAKANSYSNAFSTTAVTSPLTWNSGSQSQYALTAQNANFTVNADSGSPVDGQKMIFRFKDNGTIRNITWTTGSANSFRQIGTTLPTATVANKTVYVGVVYNSVDSRWDVIAVAQEA